MKACLKYKIMVETIYTKANLPQYSYKIMDFFNQASVYTNHPHLNQVK